MKTTQFLQRLAALGVPEQAIPGFDAGGPFRAFFSDSTDAGILAYFNQPAESDNAPGPYFDPAYYRAQNPDWSLGKSPLGHFLSCLLADDIRPAHPLFDAGDYADRYEDLAKAKSANLLHFAQYGDAEGRRPSEAFDPAFYAARYMRLAQTRAFAHYANVGQARGHLLRPLRLEQGSTKARITTQLEGADRPIFMMGHDAREAGAQLRLLALGKALRARGWSPIFILESGGPLVDQFEEIGPTTVLCEGWTLSELAGVALDVPLLAVTVETAPLVAQICKGRRSFLMVLEMPAYWRARELTQALEQAARAGTQMVFGFSPLAEGYAEDMPSALLEIPTHVILPALLPPTETCSDYLHHARAARNKNRPVIIGAGYADERKGFDWFIATAWALVGQAPTARFIWLGELSAWAKKIAEDALAKGLDLELPGFVSDANARYAAADCFLLTSRQDPGPTVLADAIGQGLPFVGFETDIGMRANLAPYPFLGSFVPAGDIAAAVQEIRNLLASDSRDCRHRRRQTVASETGFERYIKQVEALLQDE